VRVVVSGSRDWNRADKVRDFLRTLPPGSTVVEGGAGGLDTLVRRITLEEGLPLWVETQWAPWEWQGKAAGMNRNRAMLLPAPVPDFVAIFPLPQSKGTWGMKAAAEAAGLTVVRGDR
jgi:hypothetical protein